MRSRSSPTLSAATAGVALGLLVAPGGALAQEGAPTGGCQENGQAVAGAARTVRPFGRFVSSNAPVDDDVVLFKATLCR